jgi:hypothetical protein
MITLQPFPAFIPRYPKRYAVFRPKFLEFGHHAGGYDGVAFRVEGVHEGFKEGELALDGMGEEVGVDEDGVGGNEGGVVLEEEGGGYLGSKRMSLV